MTSCLIDANQQRKGHWQQRGGCNPGLLRGKSQMTSFTIKHTRVPYHSTTSFLRHAEQFFQMISATNQFLVFLMII